MSIRTWRLTALVAVMLVAGPGFADPPAGYPFLPYDEALKQAQQLHKPVFVYYGREGCGYCDKTNKESFSNPELKKLYIQNYVLAYVDAERGRRLTLPSGERITEFELGARLRAKVTPIFLYQDEHGKSLLRVPGFQTAADFLKYDRYIREGHYQRISLDQFLAQPK